MQIDGSNLRGEWLNNGFFRQFSRCTPDGNALHLPVVHWHIAGWCQSLSVPKEPAPARWAYPCQLPLLPLYGGISFYIDKFLYKVFLFFFIFLFLENLMKNNF